MLASILDFIFPKECLGCKSIGVSLCEDCEQLHMQKCFFQECHICKSKSFLDLMHSECREYSYLDGVISVYYYNEFAKDLVSKIKYDYQYAIIDDLGKYVYSALDFYNINVDLICSVPLSKKKLLIRGFNQAELLAKLTSKYFDIPYINLLTRKINTKTQVGMNREDRQSNLKDVFGVKHLPDNARNVLIVDDVMTTGSTLEECGKVLKSSGVGKVYCLVLAR